MKQVLKVLFFLLFVSFARSEELYQGCGSRDTFCTGIKGNCLATNVGECIDNKDCEVFLKIEMSSGLKRIQIKDEHEILTPATRKFRWTMAVQYNNSTADGHFCNAIYLSVTKKPVKLFWKTAMQPFVPYYSFEDTISPWFDHFEPRMRACPNYESWDFRDKYVYDQSKWTKPRCPIWKMPRSASAGFVRFGAMKPKEFADTKVNYMAAVGSSSQVMNVVYDKVINRVDLLNDKLIVSLFHWFSDGNKSSEWFLGNEPRKNTEPMYLFKKGDEAIEDNVLSDPLPPKPVDPKSEGYYEVTKTISE